MRYKKTRIIITVLVLIFVLNQPVFAKAGENVRPLSGTDASRHVGSGVRITLIDTGISCKYLDDSNVIEGKNYVFPEMGTNDLVGHGTAVAGIILGSEVFGIEGVAPDAEIVPLVFYSRYASGMPVNGGIEAICQAIYDAIDLYGCRIINISAGITSDSDKLREAIAYAGEKNVIVVSAVGNSNRSSPKVVYYPAAYETVIGVGAANEKNEAAYFSQRNSSVKLLAPGTNIPTATINNSSKPVKVNGSSYAAAFVTGAAALLLEENPELTAAQLRELLYNSAKDLGPEGYDIETGWGMLDISKALSELRNTTISLH
ncbi:MAG TPA: S8 family serine peptidase [Clostridiaceae bacterium]|nr:S8 family serine peptidase [Clostridiaceae bacterium]